MHKIVLLVLYFGRLPDHMPYWVRSCGANPGIDWVLMTDQDLDIPLPANIKYIQSDLSVVRQRFSDTLGIAPDLSRPYKLCDLRPAYGLVFADIVRGYDFWGYCDLDVIFGDVGAFITEDILDRYDKILSRGHLSFYRNTDAANTLFTVSCQGVPDYRDVFKDSRHYCFDERHGIYEIFRQKDMPHCDMEGMAAIKPYKGCFEDGISGRRNILFYWEDGKAYMADLKDGAVRTKEVMYVHFRKRRMEVSGAAGEAFYIVPNAFVPKEPGVLTVKDVATNRKGVPFYGITSRAGRLLNKGLGGYFERRAVSRIWKKAPNETNGERSI